MSLGARTRVSPISASVRQGVRSRYHRRAAVMARKAANRSAAAQMSANAELRAIEAEERAERAEELLKEKDAEDSDTAGVFGFLGNIFGAARYGAASAGAAAIARGDASYKYKPLNVKAKDAAGTSLKDVLPPEYLDSTGNLDTDQDAEELENRVKKLKILLARERKQDRRQRIQTAINQLMRAARLAKQRRGLPRKPKGAGVTPPRAVGIEQLRDKLAALKRRRDTLVAQSKKGTTTSPTGLPGIDPTVAVQIGSLTKQIEEIERRLRRLGSLPESRRNAEIVTLDREVNRGADLARSIEENPKMRYAGGKRARIDNRGVVSEDEEVSADAEAAPVAPESAAAAAAIAEEPWYKRNTLLLVGIGVGAAILGTYLFTRPKGRASAA